MNEAILAWCRLWDSRKRGEAMNEGAAGPTLSAWVSSGSVALSLPGHPALVLTRAEATDLVTSLLALLSERLPGDPETFIAKTVWGEMTHEERTLAAGVATTRLLARYRGQP